MNPISKPSEYVISSSRFRHVYDLMDFFRVGDYNIDCRSNILWADPHALVETKESVKENGVIIII